MKKFTESSGDGGVSNSDVIDTNNINFVFVAETIYTDEETAPFDGDTNKRIKKKIELQIGRAHV